SRVVQGELVDVPRSLDLRFRDQFVNLKGHLVNNAQSPVGIAAIGIEGFIFHGACPGLPAPFAVPASYRARGREAPLPGSQVDRTRAAWLAAVSCPAVGSGTPRRARATWTG